MTFQEKLRALLAEKRMSQKDLADAIGTYQTQVSRWMESDAPPKASYLLAIARVLGVTADYLIDPDQTNPAKDQLSEDERMILTLYRALGLTRDQALRGLSMMVAEATKGKEKTDA